MSTAPALDVQTAAEVVTALLARVDGAELVEHGDVYTVTRTTILRGMSGYPWGVSLTVSDETRGESINATVAVSVSPVGARWPPPTPSCGSSSPPVSPPCHRQTRHPQHRNL